MKIRVKIYGSLMEMEENIQKEMSNVSAQYLSDEVEAKLKSAITYFKNQKHRMQYAQYQRQGLPIGSSVTEAACKSLVKQRLCQSGMK